MNTPKCTEKMFIQLLRDCMGIQLHVAQKLGVTRQAVSQRIYKHPKIKEAYDSIIEEQIDRAETQLMQNMGKGDTTALIFYLKCKAKHRGYVERQELTGAGGGAIKTETENPLKDFTKKEIADIIRELNAEC